MTKNEIITTLKIWGSATSTHAIPNIVTSKNNIIVLEICIISASNLDFMFSC